MPKNIKIIFAKKKTAKIKSDILFNTRRFVVNLKSLSISLTCSNKKFQSNRLVLNVLFHFILVLFLFCFLSNLLKLSRFLER